jgi:hypothetical protein
VAEDGLPKEHGTPDDCWDTGIEWCLVKVHGKGMVLLFHGGVTTRRRASGWYNRGGYRSAIYPQDEWIPLSELNQLPGGIKP